MVQVTVHTHGNLFFFSCVLYSMHSLYNKTEEEYISTINQQAEMIAFLQKQIEEITKENLRLKGGLPETAKLPVEPPSWVKPSKPIIEDDQKKTRKKRANNFARKREQPTQELSFACENCPDCGRKLENGTEYSRKQTIEIPEIKPSITDNVTYSRYCGVCKKNFVPKVDLSDSSVGQSRFGPKVHSLIAYLRQAGRLPIRSIAALMSALCHVSLSVGEINRMLAKVASLGKTFYDGLKKQLLASPFVHGDETGWRENGINGYLWSFSTPTICYFVYPKTRAGHVVTDVLGHDYKGILVSDFYGGYNCHYGLHQRCWVHLWRDVDELKKKYPLPGVLDWIDRLKKLYKKAKSFSSPYLKVRASARVACQEELVKLCAPDVKSKLPQSTLCKRLMQFESEMFTFVEHPEVPFENNAAERAIRPRVIARKISGGTRSSEGSETMVILSSLFATWQLRGEESLSSCLKMILDSQKSPVLSPA